MNAPHDHTAYARAALERECSDVAATRQGRNDRLNRASFSIGQIVGAKALDRNEADRALFEAATACGHVQKHGPAATRATIASGLGKGAAQPREIPEPRTNGAARSRPRPQPAARPQEPARPAPKLRDAPIPDWTEPGEDGRPFLLGIGKAEPAPLKGEARRHAYRRAGGEAIRFKIKLAEGGFRNAYKVRRPSDGVVGWQYRKPADYTPVAYIGPPGAGDPFDPEHVAETMFWPEGEKDTDSLQRLGLFGFTFGGSSDTPDCRELLRGRDVVIPVDHDAAGEACVLRKVEMLRGVAARIRTIRFPELEVGGDVTDWIVDTGADAKALLGRAVDVEPEAPKSEAKGQERFDAAEPGEPFIATQAKSSKPEPRIKAVSAAELQGMTFPPIRYVVPGYVVEGCTLMAGAPKLGKSWMALEMAYSKASGGTCLGSIKTGDPADVLYLALEDNLRRLQSRMEKLTLAGEGWPARLTLATEWPRANEGGLDRIREWARAAVNPRLAIIDVFTMFRAPTTGRENAYEADYLAIKAIQALASELGIAIVVVHHTRKSRDQVDPFDRVSGTLGLSGAADAVLILDRDGNGVTLYGRGRDIPEIETAVQFNRDTCRWKVQGSAADVHRSDERTQILEVLKVTPAPMTPSEVTGATRLNGNQCKVLLFRMHVKGEVLKVGRGRYIHPDRTDLMDPP